MLAATNNTLFLVIGGVVTHAVLNIAAAAVVDGWTTSAVEHAVIRLFLDLMNDEGFAAVCADVVFVGRVGGGAIRQAGIG